MVKAPVQKKSSRLKRAIFTLHLWLGLGSGALFSLVCATGFFLALQPVLEARLNRAAPAAAGARMLPAQELVARASLLATSPLERVEVPAQAGAAWRLRSKHGTLYVDPYTGQVLPPLWGDSYNFAKKLHRWLLLDSKVGRSITSVATLIYVMMLLSGLYLWLAKCYKRPARGLSFSARAGWKRMMYDAHLALGVYALVPLLLMASTGLWWSYREPYKATLYRVLDGAVPAEAPKKEEGEKPDLPPRTDLPYAAILEQVQAELPYEGTLRVPLPDPDAATLTVGKIRVAGFWCLPVRDELVFDVETAAVVKRKLFADKTRAEKVMSLMFDIHSGAAWGNLTLAIWLLATAVGVTLPITGTAMWYNRMRGQRRAKKILADRRSPDA